MEERSFVRLIAALEMATAAGLILFWLVFFTVGLAPENASPSYFAFEKSFPLADIVLAMLLLAASRRLLLNKPWGRDLSLIASGALVFLALLDFSFNIQNGVYTASAVDLILNALINIWCAGFGVALAVLIGRKRNTPARPVN